jgi:hypothetical protein
MRSRSPHAAALAGGIVLWLCAALATAMPAPEARFVRQQALSLPGAGAYTSVAVDATGRAHVAWADAVTGALRYAWQVPGGWRSEVIEAGGAGPVGWYASLVLDPHGVAHVAFYDAGRGVLKHAERRGGTWAVEVVDGHEGAGHDCALALTPQGAAAVSYYDASALCLRYAEKVGEAWRVEVVDGEGDAAEAAAAQDRADRASKTPAISDEVANVGLYTSLAIARDGTVHVSYQDVTHADLKVAVRRGGTWTNETVDAKGDVGEHTSLKLDASGRAHVGYYDLQHGALKVARETADGTWRVETVDAAGDVGAYASLALDSEGREHVSYLDAAKGALRYAERTEGGWRTQEVDAEGGAGRDGSLALDRDGSPVIAYLAGGVSGRDAFRLVAASARADAGAAREPAAQGVALTAGPLPYRGGLLAGTLSLTAGALKGGDVGSTGDAEVSLVDVAGRHIRTLAPRQTEPGRLAFTWDGRDDRGAPVAGGVYFLAGRAGRNGTKLKLVVIR